MQGRHGSGCKVKPATVPSGRPQFLAVDARTHTIYVANVGSNTISVIDGRRCNAQRRPAAAAPRSTSRSGPAFTLALNEATHSLYVTTLGAPTVSIFDLRDCKAAELRGCFRPPVTFDVGETPGGIAINRRTEHDLRHRPGLERRLGHRRATCNARVTRGCRKRPAPRSRRPRRARHRRQRGDRHGLRREHGGEHGQRHRRRDLQRRRCTAAAARRRRRPPVGTSPRRVAVDELTNTVYVTNAGSNTVTVLNGRTCNGRVHRGCGTVALAPGGAGTPAKTRTATHPYTA